MKNFVKIFLFISIFLISRCLFSHMYEEKGIEVLHPWSTATDNDGNANAYITISNNTDKEISLIKLDTEISDVYMLMNNEKMVKKLIIPAQSIRSIDDFYIMFHGIKNLDLAIRFFSINDFVNPMTFIG